MPGPAAVAAEVDRAKTNTLGATKTPGAVLAQRPGSSLLQKGRGSNRFFCFLVGVNSWEGAIGIRYEVHYGNHYSNKVQHIHGLDLNAPR